MRPIVIMIKTVLSFNSTLEALYVENIIIILWASFFSTYVCVIVCGAYQ